MWKESCAKPKNRARLSLRQSATSPGPYDTWPVRRRSTRLRHFALSAFITLVVSYTWQSTEATSPNERARAYLGHALATRGEVAVTEEWRRFGPNFDIAHRDGAFYSDKAPGSSVLAVPVVAWAIHREPTIEIGALVGHCRNGVMVPFVFVGAFALLETLTLLGVAFRIRVLTTFALFFGSNVLHYGRAFFGHALVLSVALVALYAVLRAFRARNRRSAAPWTLLCGLACGLAFSIEYQAALLSVAIAVSLLFHRTTRRPAFWLPWVAGVVPGIVLTLSYNEAAFGSPWSTSYAHLYYGSSRAIHDQGIGGVSIPKPDALLGILFSPSRGLFFSAPWAFLVLAGIGRRSERWFLIASGLFAVLYLYVCTSWGMWEAGWGTGPRLLIGAFGPIAIFSALALERMSRGATGRLLGVAFGLIGSAIVINSLLVLTFAENPPEVLVPLRSVAIPLVEAGAFAPNLLTDGLGAEESSTFSAVLFLCCTLLPALVLIGGYFGEHGREVLTGIVVGTALFWGLLLSFPDDPVNTFPIDVHVEGLRNLHSDQR